METKGTFPLPEAQLDRFFMQLSMGYPSLLEELEILKRFKVKSPLDDLQAVITSQDLEEAKGVFESVRVSEEIMEYLILIVQATREHSEIELGISPRGSMALFRAAQAAAAISGRDYVLPDDVKKMAVPVLAHRMILNSNAVVTGRKSEDVIRHILKEAPVPTEKL